MAFTATQKTLAYELLGLFEGGTFDFYDYNDLTTGVITSVPIHNQVDFTTATTRVEAIFTAIEAAADNREVRIGEILTEYSDVSLDQVRVARGGTSASPGVRYSSEGHRRHLNKLLAANLGVRITKGTAQQGGINQGGRTIGVSR